ncbi:MAG: hypothetical protein HND47_16975 [Chloroflexi bacterium]|nr:hypothetical protein [Chloroflexota bacterium]
MMKKILPILAALALFVAACGQPAAPTMSPEEVQGTAVAAAWTMVAMTQASIPTATPPPPTETPSPTSLPTFTPRRWLHRPLHWRCPQPPQNRLVNAKVQ